MLRVRGSATQTGCVMRAVLLRLSETRHMHARHDNGPGSIRSAEFIGTEEARRRAGVAQRTIREWCVLHRIGRRIAGRWRHQERKELREMAMRTYLQAKSKEGKEQSLADIERHYRQASGACRSEC